MADKSLTQEKCKTEICTLKQTDGECCGQYLLRQRKQVDGSTKSYWLNTGKTNEQRFWERVAITADDQRCWDWIGHKTPFGYGLFSIFHDQNLAHRMVWFFTYGVMPSQWILHRCHNTSCVNPNHLYEGTPKDNAQDRIKDGTQPRGENHGRAKLKNNQVKQVKLWLLEGRTRMEIVELTGISKHNIGDIARGQKWKHIVVN